MNIFKTFFHYSPSEKRGITILFVFLIGVYLLLTQLPCDRNNFHVEVIPGIGKTDSISNNINTAQLGSYDPNIASYDELLSLGLKSYQVTQLINYRNAGGKFYRIEDLEKIYSISNKDITRIQKYIHIEQKEKRKRKAVYSTYKKNTLGYRKDYKKDYRKPIQSININLADSVLLLSLPFIGSKRAKQIIEYRSSTGGYYSISQLKEITSIPDSVLNILSNYITIDTLDITQFNINDVDFQKLQKHPYLDYYDAKNIMKYKELVGTIASVKELSDNNIISQNKFKKIKYYIKCE